ncbi:hypothetical protein [Colwellia sp. TT2012]|uniref:hypothetical protein n=1 Tax=Colwellia sp. TT2012 TaxID=1720342 RepID=UPI00070DC9F7|nr:hypothetical protein [Colwellia sp. TT2012]
MKQTIKKIDISFWKNQDEAWHLARNENWPSIEFMLSNYKQTKKSLTPIKDYYLKGKMPNWKGLREWSSDDRHLDLFLLLWLHPSHDEAVLTELRDLYINSYQVLMADVNVGFKNFLDSQILRISAGYKWFDKIRFPIVDKPNDLLFKVMFGDDYNAQFEFDDWELRFKEIFELPKTDLYEIWIMSGWLAVENMLPVHQNFLFQYSQPLEWWYDCVKNLDYFAINNGKNKRLEHVIQKALYRIHHFDTEKEGDTCRTNFVKRLRTMLDEREFVADFKQMWLDVKAGKIEVENPWEW